MEEEEEEGRKEGQAANASVERLCDFLWSEEMKLQLHLQEFTISKKENQQQRVVTE